MINSVVLLGNLTAKPILRENESGTKVTSFTLAVGDGYGDSKKTYFIPCTAWNKLAETIDKYCDKGSKVAVSGKITSNAYDTKDGRKVSYQVVVGNIEFLNTPNRDKSQDIVSEEKEDPWQDIGSVLKSDEIEISPEDLPF